ncbi:hypothetical protein [Streptomyces sp. enrichment culture]|uniref:hypothetical protein n=1 Tax=Streptomyces sp. enrichment culture TaxID=1795815 RepID=UPI003F563660
MTPSPFRGRPRRARGHISARVAHAVLGGAAGLVWLVLPTVAADSGTTPVPVTGPGPSAVAQEPRDDGTSTADLVLPLLAAGAAGAFAAYGYVRRTRRARTPAVPGRTSSTGAAVAALTDLDERCRRALVAADDSVRTSAEELGFARQRLSAGTATDRRGPAAGMAGGEGGGRAAAETHGSERFEGAPSEGEGGGRATAGAERVERFAGAPAEGQGNEGAGRATAGAEGVEAFERASAEGEGIGRFERALAEAEGELAAAFRIRQGYDDGVPEDPEARRHALAGIVGRCVEAGRRLDAQAAAFDALRDLEGAGLGGALEIAEHRFRELAGRTSAAEARLAEIARRFPPSARAPVTGFAEQAKDRLVFATTRLNQARQSSDLGHPARAATHLRAAEGAVAQAAVLLDAVHRLAAALSEAAALVPAALSGAERVGADVRARWAGGAEAASWGVREPGVRAGGAGADGVSGLPAGEVRARLARLDLVLAAVREELIGGVYDPLDALRRIARAVVPLGAGRDGVLGAAAWAVAREAVADADGFVATHRGAVRAEARTRLAEARRLLAEGAEYWPSADALARRARHLAEEDVRLHGHPLTETDVFGSGVSGAVVGGILLGDPADPPDTLAPPSFGGPTTRSRRSPAHTPDTGGHP